MKHCIFTLVFVAVSATSIFSAEKDLLRTESGLHEKLIVTDNNAFFRNKPEMQAKAENASAFSIFWRLKTGTPDNEKSGFYRIGGPDGTELGWIEKKFVTPWRTRFCLDPMLPQPDRSFSVKNNEATLKFIGQAGQIPSGHKRFALITKSADNENEEADLDVVVFTGNVESGGGVGGEKMAVANMELEIVFVMSSTYSMRPMLEMVKEITRKTADSLAKNEQIKDIVHFGLVEYRDKKGGCDFDSRLVCDLNSNYQAFNAKLETIKCTEFGADDMPDEVLIGLQTAINDAGWRPNSSKHIILLGDAPAKGQGVIILKKLYESSSNLSLEKIMNLARPQSGGDSRRAWNAKNIHAVANHQADVIDKIANSFEDKNTGEKYKKIVTDPKYIAECLEDPEEFIMRLINDVGLKKDFAIILAKDIGTNAFFKACSEKTNEQWQRLAQNQGDYQGFFLSVDTYKNDGSKDRAINGLIKALEESFKALEKARTGKTDDVKVTSGSSGAISQGIYQIITTNAPPDRFKDMSTFSGVSKSRDENGRLVAEKKIMVMKEELRQFRSVMDLLYNKFKGMSNKAQRQDVSEILKTMKESIASVASGEKQIDEGMNLDKILSFEFPLKTPVLSVSARDIAVMTTPTFNNWLEQLAAARDRTEQLLEKPDNWTPLSNGLKQEFTFLKLSELP
jgi:hypothetical protein